MKTSPFQFVHLESHESMFVSSVPMMIAISHAIEEIIINHTMSVDLYVGFQRFSYFLEQVPRYHHLAAVCRRVYVWGIADIIPPAIPNIDYLPLADDDEMAREWFLVVNSDRFFTALLTREQSTSTASERLFEGVWTYNPELVDQAARMLADRSGVPMPLVEERCYEDQSRYLAEIFTQLLKHRSQPGANEALAQHQSAILKSGITSSETPMMLLDRNKIIIAASDSACAIIGDELDRIVGQPLEACGNGIFAHRDPTLVEPPLMALLNISEKDLLATSSKPIIDPSGETIGWVLSLHYTTHRRRRVQRTTLPIVPSLQPACQEIRQHLETIGTLISRSGESWNVLTQAQQRIDWLLSHIQRLALLDTLEAQGEITLKEITVQSLLQPVFVQGRVTTRRRGITLSLDISDGLPTIACDATQVRLALNELLENVVRHAESCTLTRISASQQHGYIRFSVQDNGKGLSQDDQERIFTPFSSGRHTITPDGQVGLGLAIARAVARAHYGNLQIESTESHGSSFTLMLPSRPF